MKKGWRYGLAAAALVAAGGAAALPWVNGLRAEDAVRAGIAATDTRLAADPRSDASLALVRYERGPLGAEALARLSFPETERGNELRAVLGMPPGGTGLDMRLTLEHGVTGVDLSGRVVAEGLAGALLERLGGDADSLVLEGRVGLVSRRLELELERLAGKLDAAGDQRLQIEPLTLSLRYRTDSGDGRGQLAWGGLTLTSAARDRRWEIGTLAIDGQGTLIAGDLAEGLWEGTSEARLGPVRLTEGGRPLGSLGSATLRSETRRAGAEHMAVRLDGELEGLRATGTDLAHGRLALQVENLAVGPLLALNRTPAGGAVPEDALAGLLAAAPELQLQALELEGAGGGRLSLNGRLTLAAGAADRVRGVIASGGQALIPYTEGEVSLRVDRAVSDDLPNALAALLGQLQAFGALTVQGDQARLDASLADGRLTLNGRTWPLF